MLTLMLITNSTSATQVSLIIGRIDSNGAYLAVTIGTLQSYQMIAYMAE